MGELVSGLIEFHFLYHRLCKLIFILGHGVGVKLFASGDYETGLSPFRFYLILPPRHREDICILDRGRNKIDRADVQWQVDVVF